MKKKTNDEIILDLKKEVEDKKKLLKTTEKFTPKTNCVLHLLGNTHNLNVMSKNELIYIGAHLNLLKESGEKLFPGESLEFSGFPVSLWIEDIQGKFNNVNRKQEQDRLKKLEEKLHNLLTVETKVELEIEDLKKQI